jgi:hypothetical protein
MMRVLTPEQKAGLRRQWAEWHKRNADVLNMKRRHRYATDPEYRALCQRRVRNCRAQKLRLKEAA